MRVLFVGGSLDGFIREITPCDRYVHFVHKTTATADDFRLIDTSTLGQPRKPEGHKEMYRRTKVVRDPAIRDEDRHPSGGVSHCIFALEDP